MVALCGLLGADAALCDANLFQSTGRSIAAEPAAIAQVAPDNIAQVAPDNTPLAQRSREFDDDYTDPAPANNQTAPPYPYEPGPNQPLRRPDFDDSATANQNSNQFSFRTIYGCQITLNANDSSIASTAGSSVRYTSNNLESCGTSFTTSVRPGAVPSVETVLDTGDKIVVTALQEKRIKISYTDPLGEKTTEEIKIPTLEELLSNKNITIKKSEEITQLYTRLYTKMGEKSLFDMSAEQCDKLGKYCKSLEFISNSLSIIQLAGLAPLLLTGVGIPAFASLSVGLAFLQLPCFAAFGGDPPLPWGNALGALGRAARLNAVTRLSNGMFRYNRSLGKFGRFLDDKFQTFLNPRSAGGFSGAAGNISSANNLYREMIPDEQGTWTDRLRKSMGIRTLCEPREQQVADNSAIGKCGEPQIARGGQGVNTKQFNVRATRGTVIVFYEMCPNPDQLDILYEGNVIGTTGGLVSNRGKVSGNFEGSSDVVTVKVSAPNKGTEWAYILFCPDQRIPSSLGPLRKCN